MNCRTATERIHTALDERRNPLAEAELAEHAAGCAACRGLIAAMHMVGVALRQPLAVPAPPSAAALQPLPEPRVQPATARQRYWTAALWLAAAAAVLLVVWPALFPPAQPNGNRPAEQVVVQDGPQPADNTVAVDESADNGSTAPPAEEFANLAQQAESSYLQLAADAQANVAAAWQLVPVQAFRGGATGGVAVQPTSMWQELGAGLNPVASATADSLGALWQALPQVPAEPEERAL